MYNRQRQLTAVAVAVVAVVAAGAAAGAAAEIVAPISRARPIRCAVTVTAPNGLVAILSPHVL
jgi:hypothetical protein